MFFIKEILAVILILFFVLTLINTGMDFVLWLQEKKLKVARDPIKDLKSRVNAVECLLLFLVLWTLIAH